MDETTLQLILARLDENHEDWKDLKADVAAIRSGIVGRDNCAVFRRDFDQRLTKVEEVCVSYQATKTQLVDGTDLCEAKREAIEESGSKYAALDNRLAKLEDRERLWNLTWDTVKGNSVWKAAFLSWFVIAAMVAYDRLRVSIADYGLHTVIVVVGIIIISLLVLWAVMNRSATKKLMGWK